MCLSFLEKFTTFASLLERFFANTFDDIKSITSIHICPFVMNLHALNHYHVIALVLYDAAFPSHDPLTVTSYSFIVQTKRFLIHFESDPSFAVQVRSKWVQTMS